MNDIARELQALSLKIAACCAQAGRSPSDVKVLAVSKNQPDERIEAALGAGHMRYGENKVQEAQRHWQERRSKHSALELHMIGPLQTNKVADAVALFDMIHTLDREKLALSLAAEIGKQKRPIPCLIQVNTGEEAQKSGIKPSDLAAFLNFCRNECRLKIKGLMCIPPLDDPPGLHFALLKKMADEQGLPELSMGMSGDFEKAIALGATYIRIGTGIFGQRELSAPLA